MEHCRCPLSIISKLNLNNIKHMSTDVHFKSIILIDILNYN